MSACSIPVIWCSGKNSINMLGLASGFTQAYVLAALECKKQKLVFKQACMRCLSSSARITITDNDDGAPSNVDASFPCFIYTPKNTKGDKRQTLIKSKPASKKISVKISKKGRT